MREIQIDGAQPTDGSRTVEILTRAMARDDTEAAAMASVPVGSLSAVVKTTRTESRGFHRGEMVLLRYRTWEMQFRVTRRRHDTVYLEQVRA